MSIFADNMAFTGDIISNLISHRLLLLDGAMGTIIERLKLSEEQYRGTRLKGHPVTLSGNYDILCLTAPEIVTAIHRLYLEAGADIIETNTFNANALSQQRYQTCDLVRELNYRAARIASAEAARFSVQGRRRFVAGSLGPSEYSLLRRVSYGPDYDEISRVYEKQAEALIEGGVDLLIVETIYDLLTAKAIIEGVCRSIRKRSSELPFIISITIDNDSGLMPSGHKPEEFLTKLNPDVRPIAFGLNCCKGPRGMERSIRDIADVSPYPIIFYPSAGFPDKDGVYPESPKSFGDILSPLIRSHRLSIVGGCCGTTPEHIKILHDLII